MSTPDQPLALLDTQQDQLTVSAKDAKGFATADGPFTWSEDSSGAVVTVSDNGDGTATVSAVAPGSANVSAADPSGVTASLPVTVTAGPAQSLDISAGTPTDEPAPPAGT